MPAGSNSAAASRTEGEASRIDVAVIAREVTRHCAAYRDPVPRLALRQLANTLLALSRLAHERPDVQSVDVNPLIVKADGSLVAVDALVELGEASTKSVNHEGKGHVLLRVEELLQLLASKLSLAGCQIEPIGLT